MSNGNGDKLITSAMWKATGAIGALVLLIIVGNYTLDFFLYADAKESRNIMCIERKAEMKALGEKVEKVADDATLQIRILKDDIVKAIDKNEARQNEDMKEIKRLLNKPGRIR